MPQTVNIAGFGPMNFPDGMSKDDIAQAIDQHIYPQLQKDKALREGLAGGNQAFAQGATMGWGIPLQAASAALADKVKGSDTSFGDLYSHYRGVIDGAYEQFRKEHPVATAVNNVVGGLTTAPALGELQPLQGASLAARGLAGGVTGASAGAVASAGNAASQGRPIQASPATTAITGALGAAAPVVAQGAQAAYQALRAPVQGLQQYASGTLGKALDAFTADKTTPADALAAMRQGAAQGKPIMPADVGGANVQGLGRGAAVIPGQARDTITEALNARSEPDVALQRANADINDLSGGNTESGAEDAYNSVLSQPVPELRALITKVPSYRTAWQAMRGKMFDENPDTAPAPLFDSKGNLVRDPTVQDFDLIKRYKQSENAQASSALGLGGDPADAAVLSQSYNPAMEDFLGQIDAVQPGYAAAREAGGMGAATGKLQGIAQKAYDSAAYPNITKAIAGSGPNGAKAGDLLSAFNPDQVAEFQARQALERQILQTRSGVLLGSNTAGKSADALDLIDSATKAGSFVSDPITVPLAGLARSLSGKVLARQNQDLAEGLFSTGQKGEDFLTALDKLYQRRMSGQNASLAGAPADAFTSSQDRGNSY